MKNKIINYIDKLVVNMADERRKCKHRSMQIVFFVILFSIRGFNTIAFGADKIIYKDNLRKLYFTLDNTTKEASVGTGYASYEHNALIYPATGSSEWDTDYWTVWNDIEIPSTIVYNDENYTVTSISANAFYKSIDVMRISLPNTIKTIDYQAFGYCVNLEKVNFPSDLETISSSAFMLCHKLSKIILPSQIKAIGEGAFRDCTEAKELFIPASCNLIGNEAFNWCTGLEKIIIEDGPTPLTMGYCNEKGISYTGTKGSCMRGMFGDAENIKEVHWGRDLILSSKSNGYVYAPFAYTSNFYSETSGAQSSCTRWIKRLTFGDYVTEIPRNAFYAGSITEKITLPPNLKRINDEAFHKTFMEGTKVINFPASLEYVGPYAFEGPNGIEFKVIESDATNPPTTLWNPDKGTGYPFVPTNVIISVPAGSREAYLNDPFWGKYTINDPNDEIITVNVKTPGTFYGRLTSQGVQIETTRRLKLIGQLNEDDWAVIKTMRKIYELDLEETNVETISSNMMPKTICRVKLPHNLKSLEKQALYQIPLIGTLEIPTSCTFIGSSAASGILIDNLVLPDNGIEIGERAFFNCCDIEEVKLGYVKITGDQAFWSCKNLKTVILEDGCNITGKETFSGCYALEKIVINGDIENLGTQTFQISKEDKSNIKKVTLNGTIRQSGKNVFFSQQENSRNPHYPIWTLDIKDLNGYLKSSFTGVTSCPMNYAKEVDYNGSTLHTVSIPEGTLRVFDAMFRGCTLLETIVLPSTLEYIGEAAFEGCSIKNISLPQSLKTINFDAFKNCKSLEKLVIPNSVETINPGAFNNCSSLQSVYASYINPITLTRSNSWSNDYPFYNVNSNCYLYVPIGTSSKYQSAQWRIPNYQERGNLTITIEGEGQVVYNDATISEGSKSFSFIPYTPMNLVVVPSDGYVLNSVICNEDTITERVIDNNLSFDDPDSDITLNITFIKKAMEEYVLLDEDSEKTTQTLADLNSTTEATKTTNVKLHRTIKTKKWNTICLPFDMTAAEIVTTFGKGTKVETFESLEYDTNTATTTLRFNEVTMELGSDTVIKAGVPYLLKPGNKVDENVFKLKTKEIFCSSETFVPEKDTKTAIVDGSTISLSMQGEYNKRILTPKIFADNELYILNGDKIYFVDSDVEMKGFRCYFVFENTHDVSNNISLFNKTKILHSDGSTTCLRPLEAAKKNANNNTVYDLMGRQRNAYDNGILIKDNKKIVNK